MEGDQRACADSGVSGTNPEKQGLKLEVLRWKFTIAGVSGTNPEKQGLKRA